MKNQTCKLKLILGGKRGETLIETIVSVLILSIFLLTATTIFNISYKITANSVNAATDAQVNIINPAVLSAEDSNPASETSISFSDGEGVELATHRIILQTPDETSGIIAFEPYY